MKGIINFAKEKDDVKIPSKRDGDGCYDIYAYFDEDRIVIQPNQVRLIPTGIRSSFANNYRISIRERGSNTKSSMIVMAGQIDSNFTGEWFVAIYNGNSVPLSIDKEVKEVVKTEDFILVPYTKAIAQFAVEEIPDVSIREIPLEILKETVSERGEGMLGSSNK